MVVTKAVPEELATQAPDKQWVSNSSFLRHCSASEAVGSLSMCGTEGRARSSAYSLTKSGRHR